jgi:hypothetical protein
VDAALSSPVARTEVDKKDLVFVVRNNLRERRLELDELAPGKIAAEHGVLKMVAESSHRLEYAPQSPIVADVIAYDVPVAQAAPRFQRVTNAG